MSCLDDEVVDEAVGEGSKDEVNEDDEERKEPTWLWSQYFLSSLPMACGVGSGKAT